MSLLPRSSKWRIPTFPEAATLVLTKAIRTRFQNREPQVVDLLGNLFVIERTFSTVDFVNYWTVVIVFPIGQLMLRALLD